MVSSQAGLPTDPQGPRLSTPPSRTPHPSPPPPPGKSWLTAGRFLYSLFYSLILMICTFFGGPPRSEPLYLADKHRHKASSCPPLIRWPFTPPPGGRRRSWAGKRAASPTQHVVLDHRDFGWWRTQLLRTDACVCCMLAAGGGGAEGLPYGSDMLVLDLLEREDVTYKVDSTVNADRSLSSWPRVPVLLCLNALSLCQWTHSSHYGCTCAFY